MYNGEIYLYNFSIYTFYIRLAARNLKVIVLDFYSSALSLEQYVCVSGEEAETKWVSRFFSIYILSRLCKQWLK